ncbi:MAG TPA: Uma2 family endonuclease [Thermoanaerobaculia bacterium]|nr:Uma2 family endonuclease [Thermoanaerobaculia bacterium]
MAISAVDVRRWTREEYERMAAAGLLHPEERVELIDGIIYSMTPQSSRHAATVQLVEEALRAAFGAGYSCRVQMPLALGDWSAPEPDLAVVAGRPRDHLEVHPMSAALVVEVADRFLPYDRTQKVALYAQAGIPEYWLIDVQQKTLTVYRDPEGDTYRSRDLLRPGETVSALARPESPLAVADLLA